MRTFKIPPSVLGVSLALALLGCSSSSDEETETGPGQPDSPAKYDPSTPYEIDIDPEDLSPELTHALFPGPVGAKWVYEAATAGGVERIEISVEATTKSVWGTTARVVRDTVTVDGELVEDTWDWYGQDDDGHVWYLGEDTSEYENGVAINHEGAWEAGVNGALPGVVMVAKPELGQIYRQEYLAGEAEDFAEIVALNESVSVPAGTFTGCLKTHDQSAIDKSLDEYKYYCPGVGNVLVEEGDERVELIEYSGL